MDYLDKIKGINGNYQVEEGVNGVFIPSHTPFTIKSKVRNLGWTIGCLPPYRCCMNPGAWSTGDWQSQVPALKNAAVPLPSGKGNALVVSIPKRRMDHG